MSLVTPYRMDPAESMIGRCPIKMPRRRGRGPEDGSPSPVAKKTPRRVSEAEPPESAISSGPEPSDEPGIPPEAPDREQWLLLHSDELIRRLQEWEEALNVREMDLTRRESQLDRRQRQTRIARHAAVRPTPSETFAETR